MARFNNIKNNFLLGEVSPKSLGRTDVDAYVRACEKIKNFIVHTQGGITFRPGFQYVSNALQSATGVRLIPYIFQSDDPYVIALQAGSSTHYAFRLGSGNPPTAVSFTGPTYTASELKEIQFTQVGRWLFLVQGNHAPIVIEALTSSAFVVTNVNAGSNSAYLNTIPTGAPELYYRSQSSWAFITDESITGRWRAKRFPYSIPNINTLHTLTPSATSGVITLTSSINFFESSMVSLANYANTIFQVNDGYVQLLGISSPTVALATVIGTATDPAGALSGTGADTNWQESAWSDYRGWPKTITFFEDRIKYGGNETFPDTLWGSEDGDYFEFLIPASQNATTPYSTVLRSVKFDSINWMYPSKIINIGTASQEYIVSGRDQTEAINYANIYKVQQTAHGSAHVQALSVDSAPVFVQRSGRRLRELVFNFDEDNYRSNDIMQFNDHLINRGRDQHASFQDPKIINIQYQEIDFKVIWAIDSNGGLFGITRDRGQAIAAGFHSVVGGNLNGEAPKVESICVVPSYLGTSDELWAVIVRTIGASEFRYIERIGTEFRQPAILNSSTSILDKPLFSDSCAFVRNATKILVFSGFSHLAGESVAVVADGSYVGMKTVNGSGQITLDYAANEVIAGYPYSGVIVPVIPEAGSVIGSSQGLVKRVDKMTIRMHDTVGLKVGRDEDNLQELVFREPSVPMDQPTPLFTGDKEVELDDDYTITPKPVIVHDVPLPCNIEAIIYQGTTYE